MTSKKKNVYTVQTDIYMIYVYIYKINFIKGQSYENTMDSEYSYHTC